MTKIITTSEFNKIKNNLGTIVSTSGGFYPLHPGHISCIEESKKYGDTLVIIVNGNNFLINKKGKYFMGLETRCKIIAGLKDVDYVIPFEIENDNTVIPLLKKLKPHIFTKGGDRCDKNTIPEWEICRQLGIKIVTNVGIIQHCSSSDYLHRWCFSS